MHHWRIEAPGCESLLQGGHGGSGCRERVIAMKNDEIWLSEADRLAQETDDLLRIGARILTGLTVVTAGALAAYAYWIIG